jgi:hypothetical protein
MVQPAIAIAVRVGRDQDQARRIGEHPFERQHVRLAHPRAALKLAKPVRRSRSAISVPSPGTIPPDCQTTVGTGAVPGGGAAAANAASIRATSRSPRSGCPPARQCGGPARGCRPRSWQWEAA